MISTPSSVLPFCAQVASPSVIITFSCFSAQIFITQQFVFTSRRMNCFKIFRGWKLYVFSAVSLRFRTYYYMNLNVLFV